MIDSRAQGANHNSHTFSHAPGMDDLSDRIEWALRHAGRTQVELAEHLKISRSAVSAWCSEGKTKEIAARHLFDAARFLGVTAEWLGTGRGARTPQEQAIDQEGRVLGREAVEVARGWVALPSDQRAAFRAILDHNRGTATAGPAARRRARPDR